MNLKKMQIYYLTEILLTSLFLITSTYFWFFKRETLVYQMSQKDTIQVSETIQFTSLEKVSDKFINTITSYNFSILNNDDENQNIKISIIPNLLVDNVSNNYVKYKINDGDIQSLNMDGVIYIDNIKEFETKDITLKLWISENYSGTLNYNGRVVVS